MRFFVLLAIIFKLFLQFGETEVVLGLEVSDSALDEPNSLTHLQRRGKKSQTKTKPDTKPKSQIGGNTPNVITCKGGIRGIIQDCFECAKKLANSHLSCTMFQSCAVVIIEKDKVKQSKIQEMSAAELVYRVPQYLDPSCSANPKLKFENKSFKATIDSSKRMGVRFFKTPLKSTKVEVCNDEALKILGLKK